MSKYGKRTLCAIIMVFMYIIMLFGNPLTVYSQTPVISGVPTATFTSTSQPQTSIQRVVDGNGVVLFDRSSPNIILQTASNSITFTVSGTGGNQPINGFNCSLDNPTLSACVNNLSQSGLNNVTLTIQYNSLSATTHVFRVAAFNTQNVQDPNPATFIWTITSSSIVSGASLTPSNLGQTAADIAGIATGQAVNEFNINQGKQNARAAGLTAAVSAASTANQLVTGLNPPFLPCPVDPTKSGAADVAIYKIEGRGNMDRLLRGVNQGTIPVSLILLEDTNPDDKANLIINHNNPFIIGKLVAFPGSTKEQRSIDVELERIDTECKTTSIISNTEVLAGKSPSDTQPAIIPAHAPTGLNPPFIVCNNLVPLPKATSVTNALANVGAPEEAVPLLPNGAAAASLTGAPFTGAPFTGAPFTGAPFTGASVGLPMPTAANVLGIPNSVSGSSLPAIGSSLGVATGASTALSGSATNTVDVAKYIIRGQINTNDLKHTTGNQKMLMTLFVDLAPLEPPEVNAAITKDTNQQIVATLQLNPGSNNNWQLAGFQLTEVSTVCKTVPFVSRPLAIGGDDDKADFATQVVSGKFKSLSGTR